MLNTGVQVTEENKERVYRILKNLIVTEKLLMVLAFSFISIISSLSLELPMWFLPLFLISIFGSIILYAVKLVKA
ncbi:MAG: hypothetical protein ACERKZ_18895 [Lachnotalea sp.]